MDLQRTIRRTHRWLSIAFTLTVIANFVAMTRGQPPAVITYAPLALLSLSGLYMFALPYTRRHRSANPGLLSPEAR